MSRRVFVSYKYADTGVAPLPKPFGAPPTTARNYVDELEDLLDVADHIFQGEDDGEDLSDFKDETIGTKLKDKIFGTSTTIVMISQNMFNQTKAEEDQWIPWEISYSLKEISRGGNTSRSNAMLAVVLPDEHGNYDYVATSSSTFRCDTLTWHTNGLFEILRNNMFNRKTPKYGVCKAGCCHDQHSARDHSYIKPVRWSHFVGDLDYYIDLAHELRGRADDFDIQKVAKRT